MRSGQLNPDPSRFLRDHGVGETSHIDSSFEQILGKETRELGVAHQHRHDWRTAMSEHCQACLVQSSTEVGRVLSQRFLEFGCWILQQVECLETGTDDGRGNRVAKQVRARFLTQHVDHRFGRRRVSASASAEGLAQCAIDDVNLDVKHIRSPFPHCTKNACGVAFVHHDVRVGILVSECSNFVQRSNVAVHAENAVRDDQSHSGRL